MNIFEGDDPLGLKKLDREFSNIFKSDKKEVNETNIRRNRPGQKKQVSNVEIAKAFFKYSKDVIKFFYQLATRNNIPKDIEGIIELEKRLDKNQIDKAEAERSILRIKDLNRQEKEFRKIERHLKIESLKRKLKFIRYLLTHPLTLILVLFGGLAVMVLTLGVLLPI